MVSHTFLYAVALVCMLAATTAVDVMSSPEPELDPMGGPGLYLVSAGSETRPMKALNGVTKVCADDYPTGLSILCHPGGPSRRAAFFVNGKRVKIEYREPYYIAGDFKGRVKPWKSYPHRAVIGCKLSRGTSVSAVIQFQC